MTYEFAKYPDGTIGVFSNIWKKENGEEYVRITFERSKEYGFDTIVVELPSYEIIMEDGNYSDEEKKDFLEIVKNGAAFFFICKNRRIRNCIICHNKSRIPEKELNIICEDIALHYFQIVEKWKILTIK